MLVFSLINFSLLLTLIGNTLLQQDRYTEASRFYTAAIVFTPLNTEAWKGKKIAHVIAEERKQELTERRTVYVPTPTMQPSTTPLKKRVAGTQTLLIPVLMYHYIRINPVASDKTGYYLSVTPADFDTQMKYLVDHGYHAISLDELGAALLQGEKLPEKPIVITFDDGYRDAYTDAYPILKKYKLHGVVFIITSFVGSTRYLTWNMIDEMRKSNVFTFQSHTIDHIALTSASNEQILKEYRESKKILEKHLGYPVNWIAYPFGNVDTRVASLVPQAGYVGAFGTNYGVYQSTNYIYSLPRVRVGGGESLEMFAERLPWK